VEGEFMAERTSFEAAGMNMDLLNNFAMLYARNNKSKTKKNMRYVWLCVCGSGVWGGAKDMLKNIQPQK
jgi:hypothetical protein